MSILINNFLASYIDFTPIDKITNIKILGYEISFTLTTFVIFLMVPKI